MSSDLMPSGSSMFHWAVFAGIVMLLLRERKSAKPGGDADGGGDAGQGCDYGHDGGGHGGDGGGDGGGD